MKMRRFSKNIVAIAAALTMIISVTGCGGSEGGSENTQISAQKTVKLAYGDDTINIDGIKGEDTYLIKFDFAGDKMYFLYNESNGDTSQIKLYITDFDGKILNSINLSDGLDESSSIYVSTVSDDGTVWASVNTFNSETFESSTTLRHLNADGSLIAEKNLSDIPEIKENPGFSVDSIVIDNDGNLFTTSANKVYCFDKDANLLFVTEIPNATYISEIVISNEGKPYAFYPITDTTVTDQGLSKIQGHISLIDVEGKKVVTENSIITKPYLSIGRGYGDYLFTMAEDINISGIKADGTFEHLFNLVDLGAKCTWISSFAVNNDYMVFNNETTGEFTRVRKLDESEMVEKKNISMAAYYLDPSVREAAVKFNNTSNEYVIQITDYQQYNDYTSGNSEDMSLGLTKLNSEIAAGNIPDILAIYDSSSYTNYAKKGLYTDLNEYIDGENGLDRSTYLDHIFRGMEIDGHLYAITPSVNMTGFACKSEYIPEDGPITFDQVNSIIASHEDMKIFEDSFMTKETFINSSIMYNWDTFVSDDTTCNFNSPIFINVLELSRKYPESFDFNSVEFTDEFYDNMQSQFRKGKTLLKNFTLYDYSSYIDLKEQTFGTDISIVGFPDGLSGISATPTAVVSISASSPNKDAGWEFIKYVLSEEVQKSAYNIPVNRAALADIAEKSIEKTHEKNEDGNYIWVGSYMVDGVEYQCSPVTQETVDEVNRIIDSTTNVIYSGDVKGITKIVMEEAEKFYNDQETAEQAAENVQNRVSIYLSEKVN